MDDDNDDGYQIDETDQYRPFNFVLAEGDDPTQLIEHFNRYCQENYYATPVFSVGTLEQAINEAFNAQSIEDRRPLLIYLHHEGSVFTPLFCSEILCNDRLIDFLLDHYIVWPWDVTSASNQAKLAQWWGKIIPDSNFAHLRVDEAPLLIGVSRSSLTDPARSSSGDYQFRVLVRGDLLPGTGQRSSLQGTLQTLRVFREECFHNEGILFSDFSRLVASYPQILVQIIKYLSLNDAINVCSIHILPLLREARIRVQLVNPSDRFLAMVRHHLDPRQVTSIRLPGTLLEAKQDFSSFRVFDQLMCLSLINPEPLVSLGRFLAKFPTVRAVSLWYESEFRFDILDLPYLPFDGITHLEIHCAGTSCDHYAIDQRQDRYPRNHSIETFVFDAGHFPLASDRFCPSGDRFCFLRSAMEFIQSLVNVRRVRFIASRHQIVTLLRADQWEQLIIGCLRLDRVIIQLVDDGEFTWEEEKIEQQLRAFRPTMIFRIQTI